MEWKNKDLWYFFWRMVDHMEYLKPEEKKLAMDTLRSTDKWIDEKIRTTKTLEWRYRCTSGHEACHGGVFSGPDCPYCERYLIKLTIKDILIRKVE
jgi:hypothetical protein